jgi:membrane protease YdiL (CAAX protease family)
MATYSPVERAKPLISFPLAMFVTLVMAVAYTLLDTLQPSEPVLTLLAFFPGGLSLALLSAAGLSRDQLNLRLRRISIPGLLVLGGVTVLLLPILGSSTEWIGWHWLPALVYAPASGIAQELYFRSSLLPGLEFAFRGKKTTALLAHSLVFVGFHYRTFQAVPTLPLAVLVATVLFLAGCGWGWQVRRDRTTLWAMLQHSFFLVLMSMFNWA